MKLTGITRRIDELGRIVIPKEIRNKLHIKSGELLEIYLSSPEVISLRKYSVLNEKDMIIDSFIKILSNKIGSDLYVSTKEKIIFSSNDLYINSLISSKLEKNVNEYNNYETIKVTDEFDIKKPFKIIPLIPNGDLIGFVIYDIKKEELVKEELVNFGVKFIEEYIENN